MKALCIHGHFYQPSREDPVLGRVPYEPGAGPYGNWNERIHDHCYRPNAELGNFERISFDIGPTLTGWMAQEHSDTLDLIIQQDRANYARFGVGNAMAQGYHHTILPLATREDKITQIRWGIEEFTALFGHRPKGMWLPEAAVDLETLEILAENGIQFTILAPWQADHPAVDVTRPYRVALPGGKEFAVVFYEQNLSMRVSFDPEATVNADRFAQSHLEPAFKQGGASEPQILIIATDGELYGHHQPFRDKFLAHLTRQAISSRGIELTFPARWLKENPPAEYIRIRENTSWSCHHGVSRWKESCGCNLNGEWKTHLRAALDRVAEVVDACYLDTFGRDLSDPWELRHRYIDVILCRTSLSELLYELTGRAWGPEELARADLLLRAQYERQRMYTSCGWFFEDFDRIEPRNNVIYAAQALWLTQQVSGVDYSAQAAEWFHPVCSWRTDLRGDVFFRSRYERITRDQPKQTCGEPELTGAAD